jgi:hypothetical protein
MTPERGLFPARLGDRLLSYVRIVERIKSLFRRKPLTGEELAALAARAEAQAEAENVSDQAREAAVRHELDSQRASTSFIPPF